MAEVEFTENPEIEEALEGFKLKEKPEESEVIHTGPQGGKYRIVKGKKVYLRGEEREKTKSSKGPKLPSKVNLSKYKNHPLTTNVNVGMLLINNIVNRTILKGKDQLKYDDIENAQIGEAITYTVEHTVKVKQQSPWFVLIGAVMGYVARIGFLAITGKKKKVKDELETGYIDLQTPKKEIDLTTGNLKP